MPINLDDVSEDLGRYSESDRATIAAYFETIALTRKTKKLSPGILRSELSYWSKYPVSIVIDALRVHMKKHIGKSEPYTRGIIRNAWKGSEAQHAANGKRTQIVAGAAEQRGCFGQGDTRYISADDPLPL